MHQNCGQCLSAVWLPGYPVSPKLALVEEPALPVNPGGGYQGVEEEIVGHARNRGQEEKEQQAFPH